MTIGSLIYCLLAKPKPKLKVHIVLRNFWDIEILEGAKLACRPYHLIRNNTQTHTHPHTETLRLNHTRYTLTNTDIYTHTASGVHDETVDMVLAYCAINVPSGMTPWTLKVTIICIHSVALVAVKYWSAKKSAESGQNFWTLIKISADLLNQTN